MVKTKTTGARLLGLDPDSLLASMQGLGAPSGASELPTAPGKSAPMFVYRGKERCKLWAVSAAALPQGGVLGREGRTEACFSSLPAACGEREAQWWGLPSPSLLLSF